MESQLHYFRPDWVERTDRTIAADACVYGGTAAGVVAAVILAEQGVDVVLLHPSRNLGGMTTGGLGWTDYGRAEVIGGRSRDFYRAVGAIYGEPEVLKFPPSAAQQVIDEWVERAGFNVVRCAYLDRAEMDGAHIVSAHMVGGLTVRARVWIDATYEGDLMAAAGVPFTVGREGNAVYGEQANGVQVRHLHQFDPAGVDPFVEPGRPASGLLRHVESRNLLEHVGRGDHKVQAYCFRVCMTDDPELKIDWPRPDGYDPLAYELAVRWFAQQEKAPHAEHLPDPDAPPRKFDILPHRTPGGHHKTDTNNHGAFSSDYIGASYTWPTADHALRERIFQAHRRYQQGFYWTMANDERIPDRYREAYARWGLPRDELADTEHWPGQLYVREARRMLGEVVLTEHICRGEQPIEDPVGMGSYQLDSHNCTRFVGPDGFVRNEGDVQLKVPAPYPISYRCIVPPGGSCDNLLVPVCISASHIAYGSARMEPVFMLLGESAAWAARAALDAGSAVQEVPYPVLRAQLEAAGQVVEAED
jgi:hypothetical protein